MSFGAILWTVWTVTCSVLIFSAHPVRTPIGLVGLILALGGFFSGGQDRSSYRERSTPRSYQHQRVYYQPASGSRVREEAARRLREEAARRVREENRRVREEQTARRRREEQEEARRRRAYQPPPTSSNDQPTDISQKRRHVELLLRKADRTNFPKEAASYRAKAESLRRKYNL